MTSMLHTAVFIDGSFNTLLFFLYTKGVMYIKSFIAWSIAQKPIISSINQVNVKLNV